jgi:protein-L-isoaspartate(D-aspartate) O-methyltransferase
LDVGTGSGYQAAILAELVHQVYSIEIDPTLAAQSSNLLRELGYDNIQLRCGDGYLGWPEQAPFDAILVAAAPDHIPGALVDQLTIGGRLIIPVGKFSQTLMVIEKRDDGSVTQRSLGPVAFVPMTGRARRG